MTLLEGEEYLARVAKAKGKNHKQQPHLQSPEKQKPEPIYDLPLGPPTIEEVTEPPALPQRRPTHTNRSRIAKVLLELIDHFIATLAVVGLGSVGHSILKDGLGDPKFFDELPIRYVIDAGDIAVIAAFFTIMIMKLFSMDKN